MFVGIAAYVRLAGAYLRVNLKAQLEYRGAFISEALAMFVNDGSWVAFWLFFFQRFPLLNGWSLSDVLTVWGITTAGFGVAHGVMGNGWYLAGIILDGHLDMWLLYPRPVLPHLLLGRTMATAWGDAAFGYATFLALVRPDLPHFIMFLVLSIAVAVLFVGFSVLSASLAFYIDNAVVLSEQWRFALISFSTAPGSLFSGFSRVMLFTAIPAGFVSYLPVEALRSLSLWRAAATAGGAVAILGAGVALFYAGLRRYASGNLISMHG